MGSASYHVFCKCNRTAFGVAEAFSAPWKAVPRPTARCRRHLLLVCFPPGHQRCSGLSFAIDVSVVLEKQTLRLSTDLSVSVTGN